MEGLQLSLHQMAHLWIYITQQWSSWANMANLLIQAKEFTCPTLNVFYVETQEKAQALATPQEYGNWFFPCRLKISVLENVMCEAWPVMLRQDWSAVFCGPAPAQYHSSRTAYIPQVVTQSPKFSQIQALLRTLVRGKWRSWGPLQNKAGKGCLLIASIYWTYRRTPCRIS